MMAVQVNRALECRALSPQRSEALGVEVESRVTGLRVKLQRVAAAGVVTTHRHLTQRPDRGA